MRLTRLQRRILAILEEPGGYPFPVLTNTVARPQGLAAEIQAMTVALLGLLDAGLIHVARVRDGGSRRWIPLGVEEGRDVLQGLSMSAQWSGTFWGWREGVQDVEVILTDAGIRMGQKILGEEGWPEQPLEEYA